MLISSLQIQHVYRNLQQRLLHTPKVGIIGGYHGGNLGDIALGTSVSEVLKSKNISSGLQTIYNLEKWPKTFFAIVGGGAVGYTNSLLKVSERYKGENQNISLLGVDFMEKEYPDECISLLKKAAFVSCRSEEQAKLVQNMTNRKDIYFHPDIAFSLYNEFCERQRQRDNASREKKLLINLVPLYAKIQDNKLVPESKYKTERPELYDNFQKMHDSYKKVVREIAEASLQEGFKVESIPFTPTDNVYAKMILEGLPVTYNRYHTSPLKMIHYISNAQRIVATRYHATIFALKTGVQLYPIAYATKNKLMLQDVGISKEDYLSSDDFARGINTQRANIKVANIKIEEAEKSSLAYINDCINSLSIKS